MSDGFLQGLETAPEKLPESEESESPIAADRAAFEQSIEQKDTFLEQPMEETPLTQASTESVAAAAPVVEQAPVVQEDEVVLEVEKVLEEGLGEYVEAMPEDAQKRFRVKGREVSTQIARMVRSLKIDLHQTITLIRDWLLTIPGVNRYFLEQEAKIKTDNLVTLTRARKEDAVPKV